MTWFNTIKKENINQGSSASRQRLADVEVELGDLIEQGISDVLNRLNAETIDELDWFDKDDPIEIYSKGASKLYVDVEDDFYLQVYVSGPDTKSVSGARRNRKVKPIGTYHWESKQFNLDTRLFNDIDGKTLRNLVPTMKTRNQRMDG